MLFEVNRESLSQVFEKHLCRGEQSLHLPELQSICKNLGILPVLPRQKLVGQGTVRGLVARVLGNTMAKAALNYAQFECILQGIATSAFGSTRQGAARFFSRIAALCSTVYSVQLSTALPQARSQTCKRAENSVSLNDSSELDLNIQEALKTLKTSNAPTHSKSRSPLKVPVKGRQLSCSSQSLNVHKVGVDLSKKILSDHVALQEFLALEKQLQSETAKVTVNLGKKSTERPTAKKSAHSSHNRHQEAVQLTSAALTLQRARKKTEDPPARRAVTAKKKPKKPLLKKQLEEHRKYISKVREATFSNGLVLKLILGAWRSLV